MKPPDKNNANHSFKKHAKTNQKPKTNFPQCLPGTHSHNANCTRIAMRCCSSSHCHKFCVGETASSAGDLFSLSGEHGSALE